MSFLREMVLFYVIAGLLTSAFCDWFVWRFSNDRVDWKLSFVFFAIWPLFLCWMAFRLIVLAFRKPPSSGNPPYRF